MTRISTTFRLALLVFLFQILAAAMLLGGMGAYLSWQTGQQATRAADVLREDLLADFGRGGRQALRREVVDRSTRIVTPNAVMMLVDERGTALAGNLAAWPRDVPPDAGTLAVTLTRAGHNRGEAMRVRVTALPDGGRLLTGMVVEGTQEALRVFGEASAAALLLAITFAGATSLLAARLFASRLGEVVSALNAARDGDFGRRVRDDGARDAFGALGRVVNATLARLGGLVDELRLATDAMAHDLKSPITRMRAALERAGAGGAEGTEAIERAQAEGDRLLAIVETALSISRAEAGIGRESFVTLDPAAMLEDFAEIFGPVAEDAGRSVALDIRGTPRPLSAHRELLGQALGNLIDNALKYGCGTITLGLETAPRALILCVADQGPGIADAERADALKRFGRLDAARTRSGAGLGLSLVEAVARLHGGTIDLGDNAPGLAVRIVIPTLV